MSAANIFSSKSDYQEAICGNYVDLFGMKTGSHVDSEDS